MISKANAVGPYATHSLSSSQLGQRPSSWHTKNHCRAFCISTVAHKSLVPLFGQQTAYTPPGPSIVSAKMHLSLPSRFLLFVLFSPNPPYDTAQGFPSWFDKGGSYSYEGCAYGRPWPYCFLFAIGSFQGRISPRGDRRPFWSQNAPCPDRVSGQPAFDRRRRCRPLDLAGASAFFTRLYSPYRAWRRYTLSAFPPVQYHGICHFDCQPRP